MWENVRPRFVHLTAIERVRLRRVAMRYAGRGWAVTPGACLTRHRFVCGRAGCPTTGCHPLFENWEQAATTDPARISTWWRGRPHALLLATGRAFDAVEVPAYLGQRVLDGTRRQVAPPGTGYGQVRGPVVVTPSGRWLFLVRPGDPLRPELDQCLYVVRHGAGSWIPAPPTRLPEGPVRWAVPPEETGWLLPDSYAVQRMLVDALRALAPTPFSPLPGHVPTPRRGS
jgi:hypothetical protein